MTQAYVKVEEFWAVEAERDRLLAQVGALLSKNTRNEETVAALLQEVDEAKREGGRAVSSWKQARVDLRRLQGERDQIKLNFQQADREAVSLTAKLLDAESSLRAKMNTIVVPVPLTQDERREVEASRKWLGPSTLLKIIDRISPPPAATPAPTDAELAEKVILVVGVLSPGGSPHKVLDEVAEALRSRGAK